MVVVPSVYSLDWNGFYLVKRPTAGALYLLPLNDVVVSFVPTQHRTQSAPSAFCCRARSLNHHSTKDPGGTGSETELSDEEELLSYDIFGTFFLCKETPKRIQLIRIKMLVGIPFAVRSMVSLIRWTKWQIREFIQELVFNLRHLPVIVDIIDLLFTNEINGLPGVLG